ncbi:MAG: PAS domain-containing sensor histidine kinase [Aggregatilineales bacterium]
MDIGNKTAASQVNARDLFQQLQRQWFALIAAAPHLPEDQQRRSRILTSLLLPFIPSMIAISQWEWTGDIYRSFVILSIPYLLIVYWINRRGYHLLAACLSILFLIASPFVLFISRGDGSPAGAFTSLIWLALPIIVSYLLFRPRGIATTTLSSIGLMPTVPLLIPQVALESVLFPLFFCAVTAVLILIAAVVRDHDMRTLEARTQALRESEARYRDLFEASFDGVLVHHQGYILDANPAFETLSGYSLDELVGSQVFNLFMPEHYELVQQHQTDTDGYEARFRRKDGGEIWVEVRGKQYSYRGKIVVNVATVRDVTERRLALAQQIDLAIEREKVQVLQRFIGDMSHDLRTPLSVMKTSLYLIQRLTGQPQRQLKQLEVLQQQTEHFQRLIDDLLSMSRLDKADTSDYRFRWCDLDFVLGQIIVEQQHLFARKRLNLVYDPILPLSPMLVDEQEFRRMIKHLLLNAITHTPEGGRVEVRIHQQNPWLLIEVLDTGAGIGALDLPHIFERFYRADSARSSDHGGTGLGLSIAKKIAEAHGGSIEAESELGRGSLFRIRLPVPPPEPRTEQSSAEI